MRKVPFIGILGRRRDGTAVTSPPTWLKAVDSDIVFRAYQTSTSTSKIPFYGTPRQPDDVIRDTASRWKFAAQSSLSAWWDPTRAEDVAALGNITATYALYKMQEIMNQDPTGRRILQDRPLVNRQSLPQWIVDHATNAGADNSTLHDLTAAPSQNITFGQKEEQTENITFGETYAAFMLRNGFDPDERSPVQYIDDSELAYIMLRYRQVS
jgi:ubiquinone biosynthesis protein COQ4